MSYGTYTGATSIGQGGNATVTISANSGYGLPDSVSVSGATANYNSSTGVISLSNPTGNVSITAICPAQVVSYSISTTVSHGTYTGATSIDQNGNASVTISASDGYHLPVLVTVLGAEHTYNSSTGVISLSNPTEDVSITANCPINLYTISTTVTNGSYTGDTEITGNGMASVTISANSGYLLPASVTVTGATHTYNSSTGVVSLSNPTGNVTITASCPIIVYSISTTVTHGSYTGDATINAFGNASVTISAGSGYHLPDSVTVTGALYSYNSSTGVVSLNNPSSNVTISANCPNNTYTISTTVTNGSYTGASSILSFNSASVTISANSGYMLPASVTVTGATYIYNSSTGVISLSNPTGNVTITANCPVMSYISFTSPSNFSIATANNAKNWDGTLEWSDGTSAWATWNGTSAIATTTGEIRLRGTGNTKITGSSFSKKWVLTGTNISCAGNIENLLDYPTVASGDHPTMANYCYYYMFYGCTSLVSAPALPATTLANYCYENMFNGCTALTSAPALPATTLANWCYYEMFRGCTSLVSAPALPATTLTDRCYYDMFYGCSSLTSAPALPATTLAYSCYYSMFRDCTSLTSAPALPATTLANNCYSYMFQGCTSLASAPALPATTLATECYRGMFNSCTSLESAPALPATTLANYCYLTMFYGCTALTTAPALPATTLAEGCYSSMFYGCTALVSAPALPATTLAMQCYQNMFSGCTSLPSAPALPATTLANNCYSYMFQGCTSLASAPALPATTMKEECYQYMFQGCTSLTTAPKLPATTLADDCYSHMFQGCTSLTTAPALPATTLADICYYGMFSGCTSLKFSETQTGDYQYAYRIPTSGTGTGGSAWNSNMFTGTGGTFTSNPSINTTYYTTNPPIS